MLKIWKVAALAGVAALVLTTPSSARAPKGATSINAGDIKCLSRDRFERWAEKSAGGDPAVFARIERRYVIRRAVGASVFHFGLRRVAEGHARHARRDDGAELYGFILERSPGPRAEFAAIVAGGGVVEFVSVLDRCRNISG